MTNEKIVWKAYKKLKRKLRKHDFVVDKSGVKVVELLNYTFRGLNPYQQELHFIGKSTNTKYVKKEKAWYDSHDLSINGWVDDVKIWVDCASKDKKRTINSNYGYLVYDKGNGSQFNNCLNTLKNHKESRQALIIYNRPSIYKDAVANGKRDFICTLFQHFFIRNNKLICLTTMRSNDAVFGFLNDLPWFFSVYRDMYRKLKRKYPDLKVGYLDFTPNSFHVYERHFQMLKNMKYNNLFNRCIEKVKHLFKKEVK